jgi:EmrB/QacA subfamily drug resistance transporter
MNNIMHRSNGNKTNANKYATKLLLTMTAVALLVNYVETMVIPGIPTIQDEFGTTASLASWITSAFLIVGAATAPLFGKLGDIYGKRKIFIIVLLIYIAGLTFAIFSTSIYELLAARAIQGMGFAVVPLALALLADKLPPEKIGMAQGIISATFAIGAALGLIIGAYIEEMHGWRDAFLIALVISILLLIFSLKIIEKDIPGNRTKVDYGGIAFLIVGITLCMVYITEGPSRGWDSMDNLAFLVPGMISLLLFFVYEKRQKAPLIPLPLLKIRNILMANLIGIFSMMAMFLVFFGVTYYTQLPEPYGLGMSTIESGLTMAPAAICMLVIGPIAGRAVSRIGPKPLLIIGSLAGITGMSMFIMFRGDSTAVMIDQIITLAGVIMTMIPIINIITVSTPKENSAVSLGFNTSMRDIGGAIGPVIATTIMTSYVVSVVFVNGVVDFPSSTAFDLVFASGVVIMVTSLILSLFVKNYSFKSKKNE